MERTDVEQERGGNVDPSSGTRATTYQQAGVDAERADIGLKLLIERIKETWPPEGAPGAVKLPIGFFANVVDIGGIGLAISGDGVGTKALIAQMMDKYDTIGIDCVAMNVNDIICVGARPITMIDYLAIEDANPRLIDQLTIGLCDGAKQAEVSISGGETAQIRDIIKGYRKGYAFDLAGMAVGTVPLDRIIVGQNIQPGDAVVGVASSGVHSNGLSLAREVFFERNEFTIDHRFPELLCSLGEELLRPTHIYVREAMDVLRQGVDVKALIHVTGDGFLNLSRVETEVGYVIDTLPPAPKIFELIQKYGNVSDEEMFQVYNMGIGFCFVVPASEADRTMRIIKSHGKEAYRIGQAVGDSERRVFIKPKSLLGAGKTFKRSHQDELKQPLHS